MATPRKNTSEYRLRWKCCHSGVKSAWCAKDGFRNRVKQLNGELLKIETCYLWASIWNVSRLSRNKSTKFPVVFILLLNSFCTTLPTPLLWYYRAFLQTFSSVTILIFYIFPADTVVTTKTLQFINYYLALFIIHHESSCSSSSPFRTTHVYLTT